MSTIDLTKYPASVREHLGKVIEMRRNELGGMTRSEVSERGGPTHQTVYEIERGKKDRVNRRTLRALERAIELEPDTLINQVLNGEDPVLTTGQQRSARHQREGPNGSASDDDQALNRDALFRMMLAMGRLYGPAMIMETASDVVSELTSENPPNGH